MQHDVNSLPIETLSNERSAGLDKRRLVVFTCLLSACLVVAVGYVLYARSLLPGEVNPATASLKRVAPGSLLFVNKSLDAFGVVGALPANDPRSGKVTSLLRCDRVHYAQDRGVCLMADRGVITKYRAVFFGPDLLKTHEVPLSGIPSRTRVSHDGGVAATTVFVSGHSYAPGTFSTETSLWNLSDGNRIATLEQFTVERDGKLFRAVDFNFWGVTFARDGKRFFATLSTGGTPYLIEGNVETKTAKVLHANVECPSLSPDNRRLVFKRMEKNRGWRLYMLDLDTMQESSLSAEARNIDDQVEWLDNANVLYSLSDSPDSSTPGENIWVLPVGGGSPKIFAAKASSASVVRQ